MNEPAGAGTPAFGNQIAEAVPGAARGGMPRPNASGWSPVVSMGDAAGRAATGTTMGSGCDFDLHGIVGIRLVDASPADRATVKAQLGPLQRPLQREPDIVIRFVDRLDLPSDMGLIGLNEAGFTADAFVVLQSKGKTPARVRMALDEVGGRCEIVCERGLSAVPLLMPILNLTVLARGGLALHASAFRYQGTGVLLTGWSKGGKTEALLAFTTQGAEYIGDEWIYFTADGEQMFGLPEPIRVWDWHLTQLPTYWRQLGPGQRLRLRALRGASSALHALGRRGRGWRQQVGRVADLVDRQRYAHLRPHDAFRGRIGTLHARLDRVLFVASHAAPTTTIGEMNPALVADRMAFSLQEERTPFLSFYRKFRFAFPDRANPHIENADAIERERLHRFLRDRVCYAVHHPYPPSIPALFETIRPVITRSSPRPL